MLNIFMVTVLMGCDPVSFELGIKKCVSYPGRHYCRVGKSKLVLSVQTRDYINTWGNINIIWVVVAGYMTDRKGLCVLEDFDDNCTHKLSILLQYQFEAVLLNELLYSHLLPELVAIHWEWLDWQFRLFFHNLLNLKVLIINIGLFQEYGMISLKPIADLTESIAQLKDDCYCPSPISCHPFPTVPEISHGGEDVIKDCICSSPHAAQLKLVGVINWRLSRDCELLVHGISKVL